MLDVDYFEDALRKICELCGVTFDADSLNVWTGLVIEPPNVEFFHSKTIYGYAEKGTRKYATQQTDDLPCLRFVTNLGEFYAYLEVEKVSGNDVANFNLLVRRRFRNTFFVIDKT